MNTIKTKIGFDTKPYSIQTLYFDELFNISTKIYGKGLLIFAILLSISSSIYLKDARRETVYQLQTLQTESVQLEKQHHLLMQEYDILASQNRLKPIAAKINMRLPLDEEKISLPSHNN